MKLKSLLTCLALMLYLSATSKTWMVTNSGFTFSPNSITINFGDTMVFSLSNSHNVVEVSQSTWNTNGNTALPGGFQLPFGGGMILPTNLSVGTHYFVCSPHASSGMKGQIIVLPATGVTEVNKAVDFSVYPNPATHILTLKTNKQIAGLNFMLSDISGKVLLQDKLFNETTQIDLKNMPRGIYFIRIENSEPATKNILRIIKE